MGKEKIKKRRGTVLLRNKLGKFERLNHEQMKILINQSVQGLAPVEVIDKRGKITMQVEITGWNQLTAYMNAPMDAETALAFIWNTLRIAYDCERYGIQADKLCWDFDRVYVDPQGNLTMIYWPMTTLEQATASPLTFYYQFCGILANTDISRNILDQYIYYFYQRDYFDFQQFMQMIQSVLDQWRRGKQKEREQRKRDREREQIQALRPDRHTMVSGGWLEGFRGDKITLEREQTVFGRDQYQCSVVISGYDGISRQHAMIVNRDNQYYLVDLGSRNGTYLKGVRQNPREKVLLQDGDEIRFGNAAYVFHKSAMNQTISIHQMQRR